MTQGNGQRHERLLLSSLALLALRKCSGLLLTKGLRRSVLVRLPSLHVQNIAIRVIMACVVTGLGLFVSGSNEAECLHVCTCKHCRVCKPPHNPRDLFSLC